MVSPVTSRPDSAAAGRRAAALGAIAAALMLLAADMPASAQAADPVIAKVEGSEIRESDLKFAEEDLGDNVPQQLSGDARRDYLVAYLADVVLVAKAAEGRKLGDSDAFKSRMGYIRNKLLMESLLQTEGKSAISDAATRKVYEEAVKQMTAEQEVRARHILVATEEEAKAILAELRKGGNFEAVAKEKSKDPGAAAQGGDLGYFTKEQMVPEFAEAAFKLEKGALSEPVKSQFGWHIIKVEDKRAKQAPPFEQVKDQVENFVVRKAQADFVTKLREGAKIERLDKK